MHSGSTVQLSEDDELLPEIFSDLVPKMISR